MIQITQAITERLKLLNSIYKQIKAIQLKPVWNYLIFSGLTKHSLLDHMQDISEVTRSFICWMVILRLFPKRIKSTYKPEWHGAVLGLETHFKKENWNVNLDISGMYFPNILPLQTGIFGKNSEGLSASNTDPKEKASILDFVLVTSSVNAFSLLYLHDIHR